MCLLSGTHPIICELLRKMFDNNGEGNPYSTPNHLDGGGEKI